MTPIVFREIVNHIHHFPRKKWLYEGWLQTLPSCKAGFSRSSSTQCALFIFYFAFMFPGSGRFPGEGNGNPIQYTCLENSMDWGAWQVTVHKVAKIVKHNWATNTFTFSSLVDWILRLLIWQYFRDGVLLVTEIEKYCSIKMMKCTLWDAPNIKIRWRVGA